MTLQKEASFSEDPARYDDNRNFFPYTRNNPTNYLDPTGLFAELLCEPISQWGLGYLRRARHCRLHVKCEECKLFDKTFELEGPRPGSNHGNPRQEPFDPSRPVSVDIPVQAPSGNSHCKFEKCLASTFGFYSSNQQALPDDGPINSNSNQFVKDLITSCGGQVWFPFWGGFFGEVQ